MMYIPYHVSYNFCTNQKLISLAWTNHQHIKNLAGLEICHIHLQDEPPYYNSI